MYGKRDQLEGKQLCLGAWVLCLALFVFGVPAAFAAEAPYEFDAKLSLTGGCGTSKADEVPDPGCPEKKPPKPFSKALSIAIDPLGFEYVASYGASGSPEGSLGRIDIFSPEGVFVTELPDEFGPKSIAVDSKGNLYALEVRGGVGNEPEIARYSPTVYKPEEGKIEYGKRVVIEKFSSPSYGGVSIDRSNDHLLVSHGLFIEEYSSAAEGNNLLETITGKGLFSTTWTAVDAKRRRLYASSCPTENINECWVLVFEADAPHKLLKEVKGPTAEQKFFSGKGWMSIAVDEETGDFFVGDLELSKNVYQFNEDYELVSTLALDPALFEGGEPMQIAISNAKSAFNYEYLFVPSLKNRALAFHPPAEKPPVVESLSVTGIGEEEAELQAVIKPKGGVTAYTFEYLTQQEYEEAGNSFNGAKVAGEGTIEPTEQEAEVKAAIGGLEPETAYRFRVTAENNAGPAEPKEATFTTYSDAPLAKTCPEAHRSSYSTLLPDCRAYELVTPADTNGRPPRGIGFVGDQFQTLEASPAGGTVSFLTEGGIIPGTEGTGSFNGDLYRTTRTASGWNTESAGPNGSETVSADMGSTSPDQGYSFWAATREGSAVIGGEDTRYVRYPDGHSALIGRGSLGTDPRARGKLITEGGTHIVFETRGFNANQPVQLEENAPPTGTQAVYDRTADEVTHVVSLLPGNVTPAAAEDATYVGASGDGEGIAFTIGSKLYLRVANTTTYEIGEGVAFAGVSEGGKRVFYVKGGDLFAFDTESEEAISFTEVGNAIPVNVSAGGTRAYFVSTTAIEGSGENPNGASAQPGQQNLYLSEEGTIRFVATVTKGDVEGKLEVNVGRIEGLGLWTASITSGQLSRDSSRTTLDGTVLLFQSGANLDGYDPEGVPQIYRYDSVGDRLHCISCIPTRGPASDGSNFQSIAPSQDDPQPLSAAGFVPSLNASGNRAVFQSTEALVSRDNDETQDVYEWEEQGIGSCTRVGGCVYLISSGHSETSNYLYGLSTSGDDIFFITDDVLASGDDNTLSIYDARINGGFAEPPLIPCQEVDECRGAANPPPPLPTATSEGLGRLPDSPERSEPKHCLRGKHKVKRHGKEVCVKKKHHRKHHKTRKGAGK